MPQRTAIGRSTIALSTVIVIVTALLVVTTVSSRQVSNTTTSTITLTLTVVSQRNVTLTITSTQTSTIPPLAYLSVSGGIGVGAGGYGPVWGNLAPYVFSCLSEAAPPQGCTQEVVYPASPDVNYTINIEYPVSSSQYSWANCMWTLRPDNIQQGYAECVPINSNSFIIGTPIIG